MIVITNSHQFMHFIFFILFIKPGMEALETHTAVWCNSAALNSNLLSTLV